MKYSDKIVRLNEVKFLNSPCHIDTTKQATPYSVNSNKREETFF